MMWTIILIMVMMMATMMMNEMTKDFVRLFIVKMLGQLESLCCSMQLAFEQYVANKTEMVKMMWMIILIMMMMMATMMMMVTMMMSEMTRDQCDDPLWMELH